MEREEGQVGDGEEAVSNTATTARATAWTALTHSYTRLQQPSTTAPPAQPAVAPLDPCFSGL